MRKRCFLIGLLLGLTLLSAGVVAEARVTAAPAEARVGETVEIQVLPGEVESEGAKVIYALSVDGKNVFQGEEDDHFTAAFSPRKEGTYELQAAVVFADGTQETASVQIPVSGRKEDVQGPEMIYSQKDGSWKDKVYAKSDLDNAGCAIFTLSHALQRMGWTGEDIRPETLAVTYRKCYTKNGTANARLIYQAGQVYGYGTGNNLQKNKVELREGLRNGDLYSFGIVIGHIALMAGIDEAGQKVLVVDSAPSATFERIKKGKIYYLADDAYVEAKTPGEIPGAEYFFETGYYGGLSYYMDLEYCARRGGRLIRPRWLSYSGADGKIGAALEEIGIGESRITVNGKEMTVPTRTLTWGETQSGSLAVVTEKKNIRLNSAEGKRIGAIAPGQILPVIREEEDRLMVIYKDDRGYVQKDEVERVEPLEGEILKGKISVNGSTSGRATVKVRFGPSEKQKIIENWKTGTEVTLLGKEDAFWQVEAKGKRGWIHEDYITTNGEAKTDGTEVNQGE